MTLAKHVLIHGKVDGRLGWQHKVALVSFYVYLPCCRLGVNGYKISLGAFSMIVKSLQTFVFSSTGLRWRHQVTDIASAGQWLPTN